MEEDRALLRPPSGRPRRLALRPLTLRSKLAIICLRSNGLFDALKSKLALSRMLFEVLLLSEEVLLPIESAAPFRDCCCCNCGVKLFLLHELMLLLALLVFRRKLCNGVSFLPDPMTDEMLWFELLLLEAVPTNIEEGCCCFLKASLVLLLLVLLLLLLFLLLSLLTTLVEKDAGDEAGAIGVGDKGVTIICCC